MKNSCINKKIVIVAILSLLISIETYAQNQNKPLVGIEVPTLQADTAFINGKLSKKEKRAQKERKRVAKLLRYMVEDHKFQFEALYSIYRGHKYDAYGQTFRCYGGRVVDNLILCRDEPLNGFHGIGNSTVFKLTNIHSDPNDDYLILFEVIMKNVVIIDGHTYNRLQYDFVTNILNGETAVRVTAGDKSQKECGIFTGYINDLR